MSTMTKQKNCDHDGSAPYFMVNETVAYVEADDRVLVLNLAEEEVISEYSGSALSIWRHALVAQGFDELVGALASEYNASKEAIRPDCREFIRTLMSRGILVTRNAGDAHDLL